MWHVCFSLERRLEHGLGAVFPEGMGVRVLLACSLRVRSKAPHERVEVSAFQAGAQEGKADAA